MLNTHFKFIWKRLDNRDKLILLIIPFFSVSLALSEGIGIGLLAPLLIEGDNGSGLIQFIGDLFNDYSQSEKITYITIYMCITILFRSAFEYGNNSLMALVPIQVAHKISAQNFNNLALSRISYVHSHNFGEMYADIQSHPGYIGAIVQAVLSIVSSIVLLIVYTVILLFISVEMTAFSVVCLSLIFLGLKFGLAKVLGIVGEKVVEARILFDQYFQQMFEASKTVRLHGEEKSAIKGYYNKNDAFRDKSINKALVEHSIKPIFMALAGLVICGLLFLGNTISPDKKDYVAELILFMAVMFRMLPPVSSINNSLGNIMTAKPSLTSVERFIEATTAQRQETGVRNIAAFKSLIEIKDLSFAYEQNDSPALTNLTLTIESGTRHAFVGRSGSGKTTLINLLTALYKPASGSIKIDGQDLTDLNINQWRKRICVVSQDIFLFNDTIAYNITYGTHGSEDDIIHAAQQANAYDFIQQLPSGFDTLLGSKGVILSGGQKQRIAIARALMNKPDILVLDEATSQLDSLAQDEIQKTIDSMPADMTIIIIAHRLSTIRNADTITVLDNGKIVEQGSHSVLIAKEGLYAEMISKQDVS